MYIQSGKFKQGTVCMHATNSLSLLHVYGGTLLGRSNLSENRGE